LGAEHTICQEKSNANLLGTGFDTQTGFRGTGRRNPPPAKEMGSPKEETQRRRSFHFWWNGPRGPLLPSRLVSEQLDENTADHGTRLKIAMLSSVGVVEIGERHAVGSFVGKFIDG
jgi:hypothetical protein